MISMPRIWLGSWRAFEPSGSRCTDALEIVGDRTIAMKLVMQIDKHIVGGSTFPDFYFHWILTFVETGEKIVEFVEKGWS